MAFGFTFGGSDSAKKGGDGGSDSGKRGDHGGSETGKRHDGGHGSDSVQVRRGDGGSDSGRKGGDDMRCSSGDMSGDEGSRSGGRKREIAERSSMNCKEEEAEREDMSHSNSSSLTREGPSEIEVSEARKIQVKEAELEQAKLTAKDVHRRQEQVFGNFWSVSPLIWATVTGNMYALQKFRLLNSVTGSRDEEEGHEDAQFLQLLNVVSEEGMNCLHLAANRGQCVELTHLLQHRDILCKNLTSMKEKIRHTVKLKSLQSLQRDVDFQEVISFLVSIPGIDLNALDKKGNTPLLLASACGQVTAVELLLQASAAMDIMNEEGLNCLHIAASAGHSSVVDRVVQEAGMMDLKFLNVKSRASDNEWTALHYAVANSRIHTLELLLNYPDIAVDAQDNEGCTPLILACSLGYVPAVTILLRKGADKHIKNNAMLNSLHVAAVSGHVDVLKELTEHSNKAPEVPIPTAAASASMSEDDSDHDTLESEFEPDSFLSSSSPVVGSVEAAPSPSGSDEDEVQFARYRRSDQILHHQPAAEINMDSEVSTVSVEDY